MKGAIEFFIGMLVLVLLALLSTSYLSASIQGANARDYHAALINEIETSNYNGRVIQGLYQDAAEKGYELNRVDIIEINGKKTAEVILGYTYAIGLLNIPGEQHFIRGYAR